MDPLAILLALQDCWCDALIDPQTQESTVAVCCITASTPVLPDCCGGFAWVRLIGAYPTAEFPSPVRQAIRCRHDLWALSVELGVARCIPEPCDVLGQPCCDGELIGALSVLDDFARMRRVFGCCLPVPGGADGLKSDEMIPGNFVVGAPVGTCVTRTMQATILSSSYCGCIEEITP